MSGRSSLGGFGKSVLSFLVGGALSGAGAYWISGVSRADLKPDGASSPSRVDGRDRVSALGSIQPKDGVVEVALPPGFRPIRLGEKVEQDRRIAKGDVLAYLEGYEVRLKEVDVIDAEIRAAEAALVDEGVNEEFNLAEIDRERDHALELGKLEQEALRSKIEALRSKYDLCKKQLGDVEGLQHDKTISQQYYDQLRGQEKISGEELKYANAEARRAESALKLNTGPARIDRQKQRVHLLAERSRSQVSIKSLRKKKELAEEMVERSKVLSPIAGVVLEICTRAGESGAGKPLVRLGDTSRMFVLAEIYEDDRWRVRDGQTVEIRGRGLPSGGEKMIPGKVARIHSIIGSHKQSPLDPTSRDNARVFPAWIELDLDAGDPAQEARLEELRRLILLPVEVTIIVPARSPRATAR